MNHYVIDADLLKKMIIYGYHMVDTEKEIINSMNVFPVPDGDTGTNMSLTLKSAYEMLNKQDPKTINEISKILAKGALMGARGNSGVILSQILGGFSKSIGDLENITVEDFHKAMKCAVEYAYRAVIKPVEGTILTVIRESVESFDSEDICSYDFNKYLKRLVEQAKISLDNTPKKLSVLKKAGVVDSGGRGLLSLFTGLYHCIIGKEIEIENRVQANTIFEHEDDHGEINYTYCTEFILNNVQGDADGLKEKILELGDSVVYVKDDDLIKVHVHTDHPGKALEYGLKFGSLYTVKIENMREQNKEFTKKKEEPQKNYGFISICAGDGFNDFFNDLGCYVIEGGQTMNPSTEDILKAIDKINAKTIFILPNNSNIILAANQARDLSDKDVHVLPTKTVPQGLNAMLYVDQELSKEELISSMENAISAVETLSITIAVRDSEFQGKKIKKNEFMALFNSELYAKDKKLMRLLKNVLLDLSKNYDMITIYYGEEVDIRQLEKVVDEIGDAVSDVDIEVYHGGQPVYHFIISLE